MSSEQNNSNGTSDSYSTDRRTVLKATGAAGALSVGVGSGVVGSAAGGISEFDNLSVDSSSNEIVDESGDTFKIRGLNIPDPKRLAITENIRGKTIDDIIDMITDNTNNWYPRAIRVPAQPADIGEHPNGNTGPTYGEDHPAVQAGDFPASRARQRPAQPQAFTQQQLDDYLEDYYDHAVQKCKERGVYCIIDYHRHWHEQPPGSGDEGPYWENVDGSAECENHLAYESDYTLYWAKNTYYGQDGEDKPASWGYVDQKFRNEADNPYFSDQNDFQSRVDETPYGSWEVNQDLVDECVMFWETVAPRYADEPHVIYEPYNEPTAPGIWGPAQGGCGWYKQVPLWDTFREDFAAPILDAVRGNDRDYSYDGLIMMGLPGWCQATQALHWGGFDELGYEDIACVWHNYAGHGVSEQENWLNDTDYGSDPCNGWEPYESQGLQEAQSVHPIAITEFGWQEPEYTENNIEGNINISKWLRGSTTGKGNTEEYGQPFLEAVETDDRLSWVAWCADPRWLTAMFKVEFPINETTFNLENGSWYDTDEADYPINCEPQEMPCDWSLWGNPNMGKHTKQVLADKKDDLVPLPTEEIGGGGGDGPSWPSNPAAQDPDGDGQYEDLTGNGQIDNQDVVTYFQNMGTSNSASPMAQDGNLQYYDYTGNDQIDYQDLIQLFGEIA